MRLLTLCAGLLALANMAGCAPTNIAASVPPATAERHAANATGTILSMRTVTAGSKSESWRAVLLADAGTAGTVSDSGSSPVVEFIVRVDSGAILSIVQANEPGFRPGDRVIILRDSQTRLARPG